MSQSSAVSPHLLSDPARNLYSQLAKSESVGGNSAKPQPTVLLLDRMSSSGHDRKVGGMDSWPPSCCSSLASSALEVCDRWIS